MRVVVTNAVLTNSGDAAIFQGIQESVVRAGVCDAGEVVVLDNNAKVSHDLYPQWSVFQQPSIPVGSKSRLRRFFSRAAKEAVCRLITAFPAIVRTFPQIFSPDSKSDLLKGIGILASADVVISSGGTYLVDHYDFGARVSELKMAAAMNIPVFLWTQSMGPFKDQRARRSIARLAGVPDAVFFRDERSMRSWESVLPLPAVARVVPDVVFSLSDKGLTTNETTDREKSVVVSVRRWTSAVYGNDFEFSAYANSMHQAMKEITDRGYAVSALSTCQGTPGYSVDDSKTAQEIFSGLAVDIDRDHHTPDQLLDAVRDQDVVIATRMHLAILALVAGRPVIAIAYEFKTKELFEGLGLGENVAAIEDITADWIVSRFDSVVANPQAASLSPQAREELRVAAGIPASDLRDHLVGIAAR